MKNQLKSGEKLVELYDQLRQLLDNTSTRLEASGAERTIGIREAMGRDCAFYEQSMKIFLRKDYKELRDLTREIYLLIEEIENNVKE